MAPLEPGTPATTSLPGARRPASMVLAVALFASVGALPSVGGDDPAPPPPPPEVVVDAEQELAAPPAPDTAPAPVVPESAPAPVVPSPPVAADTVAADSVAADTVTEVAPAVSPVVAEVPLAAVLAFLDFLHRLLTWLYSLSQPPGWTDLGHGVWGPAHLVSIRRCESGHNYGSVSRSGSFRGAYQFSQRTWNVIAGRNGRHDLVGVRPNEVAPADQDQMAVWNYQQANPRRQWPVCSRR
jgi:hypothetical protein